MKSTSKFPNLKSTAVFGCFLPFSKICFSGLHWCSMQGDYLFSEISEIEAVDCEILFVSTSCSTLFSDFSWTCISQQNLHVKALFRNTLSFLYVWFSIQWGEHWWNCVLIIMLCELSDSFDKNPHHLQDDFILIIILWWVVYTYKIDAKKNILMLCLKCSHNVLKSI